ncbi:MAG: type II toxin-antitoxin system VapC family toxin [Bryobacteraceae bacterium]
MIVDASAIIAILRQEPEARTFAQCMEGARELQISAPNYVEAGIVIDAEKNPIASRRLDDLMLRAALQIAPVTSEQAHLAREAYRNFGRGSGHPAKLNFGDCFAYALAVTTGQPLLAKGDEFRKAGLPHASE